MGWITLMLLVIYFLCLGHHEAKQEESFDVKLEEQLKILNKPPIKTFQDQGGGIFDCIDIRKQPAFDHPLLKNHKLQMRPTFLPQSLSRKFSSSSLLALKGLECPQGTVPIRRTGKKDLQRGQAFFKQYYSTLGNQESANNPGQYRAYARTTTKLMRYFKIQGWINVQNPRVKEDQWSTSNFWVENGANNSIQAGWMVAPSLYGDALTHFFAAWKSMDMGCYNVLCSGFIQVDSRYPLGLAFHRSSEYGSTQFDLELSIVQDNSTKDWWLLQLALNPPIKVGYWPSKLFPLLTDGADVLGWGGTASGPVNGESPPMGNSYFPNGDGNFKTASYVVQIKVSNETDINKSFLPEQVETKTDSKKCYGVKDYGYLMANGYSTQFGGPGGLCGV